MTTSGSALDEVFGVKKFESEFIVLARLEDHIRMRTDAVRRGDAHVDGLDLAQCHGSEEVGKCFEDRPTRRRILQDTAPRFGVRLRNGVRRHELFRNGPLFREGRAGGGRQR